MISKKDIFRPIVGLIMIQPIVLIWLFMTSNNPFSNYISVGWGLQILITVWLIPVYYYYEKIWNSISFEDSKVSE